MKSLTHGPFLVSITYNPIKIKVHEKLKLAKREKGGRERLKKKNRRKINMNGGNLLIGLLGVLSFILFYIHIYYNKMFFKGN